MPVTRHVEPEREPAVRSISRIPPGDRTICSTPGAGVSPAVFLPHPGIERQEVVAAQNSEEFLRGVRAEAVLGDAIAAFSAPRLKARVRCGYRAASLRSTSREKTRRAIGASRR